MMNTNSPINKPSVSFKDLYDEEYPNSYKEKMLLMHEKNCEKIFDNFENVKKAQSFHM